MKPAVAVDFDQLLRHSAWMRGLAASLTADPSAAEDVVQDTWMAALRKPPEATRPLGPWLASVLRNLAWKHRRAEVRRENREQRACRSGETSRPEETLARLEVARKLVEAVAGLEEPLRTTIVMRFFEERSCADIARVQDVPAGTVRWRLQRALAVLRERLDAKFEGSREDWLTALAPLLGRGGAEAPLFTTAVTKSVLTTEGVLLMGALKIAGGAGLAMIVAAAWWWNHSAEHSAPASGSRESSASGLEAPQDNQSASADTPSAPPESVQRVSLAEPSPDFAAKPPATQDKRNGTATVDVRFVDTLGVPWVGVQFAMLGTPEGNGALSDSDGRARLEVEFRRRTVHDPTAVGGYGTRALDQGQVELLARRAGCATAVMTSAVRGGETVHLGDRVLVASVRLSGSVVDETGRPMAGATVGLSLPKLPANDEGRMRRLGSDAFFSAVSTTSASDGTFELGGVAPGSWRVWSKAEGMRYSWSEPFLAEPQRDVNELKLTLTPFLPTDRIAGRVFDPDGKPAPDGFVEYHGPGTTQTMGTSATIGVEGRFEFLLVEDGAYELTAYRRGFAEGKVEGVAPGTTDVVMTLGRLRTIDVHLVDSAGQALEGGQFRVSDKLHNGTILEVRPESAGHYCLTVMGGTLNVEASAPKFRKQKRGPFEPDALPPSLEFVLLPARIVRGRVVADGHAVAGARMTLRPDRTSMGSLVNGFRCTMSSFPTAWATTGDDGRFELDCDLDDRIPRFWICGELDGWAMAELGPIEAAQLTGDNSDFELTLPRPGAIEGRVLLPDGKDGEGAIVALNHGDGRACTVRAGPKGYFRADQLTPGKWQVLSRATELDPTRMAYSGTNDTSPIEWNCEVVAGGTTHFDLDLTKR